MRCVIGVRMIPMTAMKTRPHTSAYPDMKTLAYPGAAEMAARLVALLPAAVRAVTAFWGDRWPQRALVIATGSDQEFAALAVSGGADVSAAAAATVYTTLDVPNHAVTGQRIVFTPAASRLATPE